MRRNWTHLPFERYADDIIVHCRTEREANLVRLKIEARLKQCGLELHPEKTKIVYCKDGNRQGTHPTRRSTFWGSRFGPGKQTDARESFLVSVQPSRRLRLRESGMRFEDGTASLYGAVHRRSCAEDQSQTSRVVQLLWALHAFGAPAHREACRPIVGSLGLSEIQEATQSPASGMDMADGSSRSSAGTAWAMEAPA
jgi:hypothetical protein